MNVGEGEYYGPFTGAVLPTFVGEDGPFSHRKWWVDRTCKSLLIKHCIVPKNVDLYSVFLVLV